MLFLTSQTTQSRALLKGLTAASAAASLATVIGLSTIGDASAAPTSTTPTYRIDTRNGQPLTIRSGPGTNSASIGSLNDGALVALTCQVRGQQVSGTFGTSTLWDRTTSGGYISDTYVYTGHDGQFLPTCTQSTQPGTATVLVNDYPYRKNFPYRGDPTDRWNFYQGQCTSFVAWRLESRSKIAFRNWYRGVHFSNANTWDEAARKLGFAVNKTPAVGAVAQWNTGKFGHVAWVSRVDKAKGTVTLEEYNRRGTEQYSTRTVTTSSVENYIHIR